MDELYDLEGNFFEDSDGEDEEFRSCCAEEEEWRNQEGAIEESLEDNDDCVTFNLFSKGVSVLKEGESDIRVSGIGVVMERSHKILVHQVQKKLDFYVEELVAEHLALMDGLLEALKSNAHRVFAFTDSEMLYDQIVRGERCKDQLLTALSERILEHAGKLDFFVLQLVPSSQLEKPLRLAQEAIGDRSCEDCPICCEEKFPSQLITLKCSHKICSQCLTTYVDKKLARMQVPIRCPQFRCKYLISTSECNTFLPNPTYKKLERAYVDVSLHCPYPDCLVVLSLQECMSTNASSSSHSAVNCIHCRECKRLFCIECRVPWHTSTSCAEYIEQRNAGEITLHQLADRQMWRRCQECGRLIELTQGCYHLTCWCGHEFCYSCGTEYRDGQQICQCAFWDDVNFDVVSTETTVNQDVEPWRWDSFNTLPTLTDGYSDQERSQLALFQRFLTGGFSLSDLHPIQSPPQCSDSYSDTIKDLHQLPWLERFVSVISDNFYEDYIQE